MSAANETSSNANGSGPDDVRVFVVDDDRLFREGLAELLGAKGLTIVGTAGSGETLLEKVFDADPDVVLMDLQMPGLGGVETIYRLRAVAPDVRVLVLTISGADEDVLEAMLAGATGYLVKGTLPETLVAGIRVAAGGGALLSPGLATKLLGRIRPAPAPIPAPAALLSDRELEVLELLARGKPNAEIAQTLFLSPHTVRNHISNILAKLQISNRTEATAYAIHAGLVQGSSAV
ncbi:MAG TPA: response regulator transcription factor [Gaiellaceae bacterium]